MIKSKKQREELNVQKYNIVGNVHNILCYFTL